LYNFTAIFFPGNSMP